MFVHHAANLLYSSHSVVQHYHATSWRHVVQQINLMDIDLCSAVSLIRVIVNAVYHQWTCLKSVLYNWFWSTLHERISPQAQPRFVWTSEWFPFSRPRKGPSNEYVDSTSNRSSNVFRESSLWLFQNRKGHKPNQILSLGAVHRALFKERTVSHWIVY